MRGIQVVRLAVVVAIAVGSGGDGGCAGTGVEAAQPRQGLHCRRAVAARDRRSARGGCRSERAETRRGALLARAQPEPIRRPGLGRGDDWAARARLPVEHVGQAGAIAADRDRRALESQRRLVVDGAFAAGPVSCAARAARPHPPQAAIVAGSAVPSNGATGSEAAAAGQVLVSRQVRPRTRICGFRRLAP